MHSTLYTLHPTPYTLHPTPYTLHPTHSRESNGGGWGGGCRSVASLILQPREQAWCPVLYGTTHVPTRWALLRTRCKATIIETLGFRD